MNPQPLNIELRRKLHELRQTRYKFPTRKAQKLSCPNHLEFKLREISLFSYYLEAAYTTCMHKDKNSCLTIQPFLIVITKRREEKAAQVAPHGFHSAIRRNLYSTSHSFAVKNSPPKELSRSVEKSSMTLRAGFFSMRKVTSRLKFIPICRLVPTRCSLIRLFPPCLVVTFG